MKHASTSALDQLEALLGALRNRSQIHEKKSGIFHRNSTAFLHFHEDPDGLFADLKVGGAFERLPASSSEQRGELLNRVDALLKGERQQR